MSEIPDTRGASPRSPTVLLLLARLCVFLLIGICLLALYDLLSSTSDRGDLSALGYYFVPLTAAWLVIVLAYWLRWAYLKVRDARGTVNTSKDSSIRSAFCLYGMLSFALLVLTRVVPQIARM